LKFDTSPFKSDISLLININFASIITRLAPTSNTDFCDCNPSTSDCNPATPDSTADTCPYIPLILPSITFILSSVSQNLVLVVASNLVTLDFTSETSVEIVLTSVLMSWTSVFILFMSDECLDISF
jgi:hypothetical protein